MLSTSEVAGRCRALSGLSQVHLQALASCASLVVLEAGQAVFHEGQTAGAFYVLTHGRVSLQIRPPGRGPITLQTIQPGEILGWSWLFPPYRWHFDAVSVDDGEALHIDAVCLRSKFDVDPHLRSELIERFAHVMFERLQATRLQLLDMYGDGDEPPPSHMERSHGG